MGDTRAGLRFYLTGLALAILSPVISSKDKPARLIIRSLFGFASQFQTEPLDPCNYDMLDIPIPGPSDFSRDPFLPRKVLSKVVKRERIPKLEFYLLLVL